MKIIMMLLFFIIILAQEPSLERQIEDALKLLESLRADEAEAVPAFVPDPGKDGLFRFEVLGRIHDHAVLSSVCKDVWAKSEKEAVQIANAMLKTPTIVSCANGQQIPIKSLEARRTGQWR